MASAILICWRLAARSAAKDRRDPLQSPRRLAGARQRERRGFEHGRFSRPARALPSTRRSPLPLSSLLQYAGRRTCAGCDHQQAKVTPLLPRPVRARKRLKLGQYRHRRVSRPEGFHLQPLAEPGVRLSPHPAPIRQACRHRRAANAQRACASHARSSPGRDARVLNGDGSACTFASTK